MNRDELFDAVTRQRHQLLGTLDALAPSDWDVDSLCEGWRVRDVVGHLVSSLQVSTGRFALGAVRARSFDRYADEVARALGARDPKWLVAALRIFADKRVALPVIGPVASLIDAYVHTRDIERPLHRPSLLDRDVLCTLLDHLCVPKRFGIVLVGATKGLRIEAIDLDWTHGDGPVVAGNGETLLLALAKRAAVYDELKGEAADVLIERLSA